MSDECLYSVRVETNEALAEMTGELMPAHDMFPAIWIDDSRDYGRVDFFCDTPEEAEALIAKIRPIFASWELGESPECVVIELAREDWAESWKVGFSAEQVSERIMIRPSWEDVSPGPGVQVITIDPGMSFGTGHHGTTRACLRFLDAELARCPGVRVADLGCGTGILSLAAALLGSPEVIAIDLDPDAIRVAQENLALNNCAENVQLEVRDLASMSGTQSGIVIANILATVLIENVNVVAGTVAPGGSLILSGILTRQFESVCSAYQAVGFEEIERITLDEWTSGLFRATQP